VITRESLTSALESELAALGRTISDRNLENALQAYDAVMEHSGMVTAGSTVSARDYAKPAWVELPFEGARIAAPTVYAAANSVEVRTGLWRTLRPIIDYDRCKRCWWVCSTFCPDGAIDVSADGQPQIDYDHCKGCMVCVAQCPPHAIAAIPEQQAQAADAQAAGTMEESS
jgi:pyruvate ferredoxin oxidoreductase gamma subunit